MRALPCCDFMYVRGCFYGGDSTCLEFQEIASWKSPHRDCLSCKFFWLQYHPAGNHATPPHVRRPLGFGARCPWRTRILCCLALHCALVRPELGDKWIVAGHA